MEKEELMNMLTMNHSLFFDCYTEWSIVLEAVVGMCSWSPSRTLTDNIVIDLSLDLDQPSACAEADMSPLLRLRQSVRSSVFRVITASVQYL